MKLNKSSLVVFLLAMVHAVTAQWQYNGGKIYYNGGNVGIGTSNPATKLYINTTSTALQSPGDIHLGTYGENVGGTLYFDSYPASFITTAHHTNVNSLHIESSYSMSLRTNKLGDYTGSLLFYIGSGVPTARMGLDMFYYNGGNFGIGTANPSSKLEVAGMIHSSSGGYKFPDGTIQTTAGGGAGGGWTFGAGNNIYRLNGNVGIGLSNPSTPLDVEGTVKANYLSVDAQNATTEGGEIYLAGAASNPAWNLDVYMGRFRLHSNGVEKFAVNSAGQVGIGTWDPKDLLHLYSTSNNCYLRFGRTDASPFRVGIDGADQNKFVIKVDGMSIFNIDPASKLITMGTNNISPSVKVIGDLCVVPSADQGCDYVFEPDYDLKNLDQVAAFIKANKHLPDVASAREMQEKKDINLVEMNFTLLKKVEELTLYLIQQKQEIDKLRQEFSRITSK